MADIKLQESLFKQLVRYHCLDDHSEAAAIADQLEQKLQRIVQHNLYQQSKTDPDPAEREKARLRYLDSVQMPEDFRY